MTAFATTSAVWLTPRRRTFTQYLALAVTVLAVSLLLTDPAYAQAADLGEFEHVVSVAKRPATIGRGTAIGLFHDPQQRVPLERSIPGEGVGNRLGGGNRGFSEIEFESCG
ncbi:hypothetical protein [Sphingomonas sp. CCH21-G11]|uniref:hypothetical protein n=1 Tax=Sphingomonas sp. CCH21-G11 TaxID=1768749 RepID=UPI00082DD29A|nr:hypothetical protein [Sphingomonas sp. CCH21-G11]